ncbi:MAG: redoxin domain-containing protein [Candidatus Kerfeldbacteria bacterium]|nr:redoxin domain-containing protein [Candidatus Kerfeldbacteria bacterium]
MSVTITLRKTTAVATLALVVLVAVITTLAVRNSAGEGSETAGGDGGAKARSGAKSFYDLADSPAPDFSLLDYNGKTVNLSDFQGRKVVLFFNEGLMCYPGCWNQIAALGQDERFRGEVVALSVVVDPRDQWSQAVAKLPELAQANVLFDLDKEVSKAYGVLSLGSSMHPGQLPGHSYVVIDRERVVRFVHDDPRMAIWNDKLVQELAQLP